MSTASVLSAKAKSLWKGTRDMVPAGPGAFFPLPGPELEGPAEAGRGDEAFSSAAFQDSGMAFSPQDP
jgi:hypothetical protein